MRTFLIALACGLTGCAASKGSSATQPPPATMPTGPYYFVYGAPDSGQKLCTGHESVVSALIDAGFTHDNWPGQVSLSRPAKNGQPRATAVINIREMVASGDMSRNFLIEPGDVLFVPHSP
jgi:hypothetical protein